MAKKKANYVDGFVLPVPKKNLAKYRKMAQIASQVWMDHGAISYVEAVADDVPGGKITSFGKSVKLKKGEVVVFSFATYPSKSVRNRVMKKMMSDPRLDGYMNPDALPFDGMRMFWGGFKPIVNVE